MKDEKVLERASFSYSPFIPQPSSSSFLRAILIITRAFQLKDQVLYDCAIFVRDASRPLPLSRRCAPALSVV